MQVAETADSDGCKSKGNVLTLITQSFRGYMTFKWGLDVEVQYWYQRLSLSSSSSSQGFILWLGDECQGFRWLTFLLTSSWKKQSVFFRKAFGISRKFFFPKVPSKCLSTGHTESITVVRGKDVLILNLKGDTLQIWNQLRLSVSETEVCMGWGLGRRG